MLRFVGAACLFSAALMMGSVGGVQARSQTAVVTGVKGKISQGGAARSMSLKRGRQAVRQLSVLRAAQAGEGGTPLRGNNGNSPQMSLEEVGGRTAVLEQIARRAYAIRRRYRGCEALRCPPIDCHRNIALLQLLVTADSVIDQYLEALNAESLDAALINVALLTAGDLAFEDWEQSRQAALRLQTLRQMDVILRELTALRPLFYHSDLERSLKPAAVAKLAALKTRLQDALVLFEALDSAVASLIKNVKRLAETAPAAKAAPVLAGDLRRLGLITRAATVAQMRKGLAKWRQEIAAARGSLRKLSQAASQAAKLAGEVAPADADIDDADKDGLDRVVRQLLSRFDQTGAVPRRFIDQLAIAFSDEKLARRKAAIAATTLPAAQEGPVGGDIRSFYRQWKGILAEQAAARNALMAVRLARRGLSRCLQSWCGAYHLTTRARGAFLDPADNEYSWVVAIKTLAPEIDRLGRQLREQVPVFGQALLRDPANCPATRPVSASGNGRLKVFGQVNKTLPAAETATANCHKCQTLADGINVQKASLIELESEIAQVIGDGRGVEILPQERQKQLDEADLFREQIDQLTALAGRNPGGEAGAQLLALRAEAYLREAQAAYVQQEIERLKASHAKLGDLEAEAARLKRQIRHWRRRLANCEAQFCPVQQAAADDKERQPGITPDPLPANGELPEDHEPPIARGLRPQPPTKSRGQRSRPVAASPQRTAQKSATAAAGRGRKGGEVGARKTPRKKLPQKPKTSVSPRDEAQMAAVAVKAPSSVSEAAWRAEPFEMGERGRARGWLTVSVIHLRLNDLQAEFLRDAAGAPLVRLQDEAGLSGLHIGARMQAPQLGTVAFLPALDWLGLDARLAFGERQSGPLAISDAGGNITIPLPNGGAVATGAGNALLRHRRKLGVLDLAASAGRRLWATETVRLALFGGTGYTHIISDELVGFEAGAVSGRYVHEGTVNCLRGVTGLAGAVRLGQIGKGVTASATGKAELGANYCHAHVEAFGAAGLTQAAASVSGTESFFYSRFEAGLALTIPSGFAAPMQLHLSGAVSKGALPIPVLRYNATAADPLDLDFNDDWSTELRATLRIPLEF